MTDEKRNTLSLKRKSTENSEAVSPNKTIVVGRKKVITVSAPPAWKVKKQVLAEKVPPKVEAPSSPRPKKSKDEPVQAPKPVARPVRKHKGLRLIPLDEAISEMKSYWPGLFDGETPRLMEIGIREKLVADMQQNGYAISQKRIKRCLKAIATSDIYLQQMVAGAPRYTIDGQVVSTIDETSQQYAAERINRQHKP